jgi:hypothetical protein
MEGDDVRYFSQDEIPNVRFANILKGIVMDYLQCGKNRPE